MDSVLVNLYLIENEKSWFFVSVLNDLEINFFGRKPFYFFLVSIVSCGQLLMLLSRTRLLIKLSSSHLSIWLHFFCCYFAFWRNVEEKKLKKFFIHSFLFITLCFYFSWSDWFILDLITLCFNVDGSEQYMLDLKLP